MGWAIPIPVPKYPKVIPAHPCYDYGDTIAEKIEGDAGLQKLLDF